MLKKHDLDTLFPKELTARKEYHLMHLDDDYKVACLVDNETWEVDALSNTLNEQMELGLLTVEQVKVFLDARCISPKDLH